MSEPVITFGFNHDAVGDTQWGFNGGNEEDPNKNGWRDIEPSTSLVCFMGGGIDDPDEANGGTNALGNSTLVSGTRSATIRPSVTSYVIPYVYIEKDIYMYYASKVGHNTNRYAMGVYIKGEMTSDMYMEAWDSSDFSTTNLEVLTGTANSNYNSFINAIRTTDDSPPWHAWGWNGEDTGAAYLRGSEHRVRLGNKELIEDETVYYNMYIRLPTDCSTFHALPVIAFRYLYT